MSTNDPVWQKKYRRKHYLANREKYKKKARDRSKRQRAILHAVILDYLKNHPCVDCGETDPVVLDFDHRDRKTKEKGVVELVYDDISVERLMEEIEKCDIRCANDHRRKTYRENGSTHRDF